MRYASVPVWHPSQLKRTGPQLLINSGFLPKAFVRGIALRRRQAKYKMDSDVSESPEVQPTLDGFAEPETQAAPEAQSEAPEAPAQSPADSEGAVGSETQAAPEAQSEAPEAKQRPQNRQGNSGQGHPRRRRRRRGRRRRKPRGQSQHHYSEEELKAQLPDDPEQLEAESRPLGILEVLGSGSGFVRRRESGYTPGNDDIYVGSRMIQRYGLRTGDELVGIVGRSARPGKSPPLAHLARVNDHPADEATRRPDFQQLSAMHPDDQLVLECGREFLGQPDYTNRVIDLICPFGKGQRAMIVAPAKAGKTMVLQAVAEGIVKNNPECHLLILLVDERPEEVTEMEQCGFGEVIASTFDRPAERHCQVAEITLERARRRVEQGEDVVIILDSITRMARAYNSVKSGSGRTLSGGLDSNSLEKPKRFLGSARKTDPTQGGGSLTIIATALVDTGSRMDQVIFEEFKGTGN
ncbi:MAG TPA: transcription termination factor Rho, partial [Gemmatimonadetes bacterium]|nr:transcription termination factor Rho [Gemmatimonadota bacterium]